MLHATYVVEKFLRALHQRKCHFHVVFFSEHAEMCVPPNIPVYLRSRYLLAREAILQHLAYSLPSNVSIKVRTFESYRAADFIDYLTERGIYFIMCHDGSFLQSDIAYDHDHELGGEPLKNYSQASFGKSSLSERDSALTGKYLKKVVSRSMIYWFIRGGYNIALINSVECRDTKVCYRSALSSMDLTRPRTRI